MSDPTPERRCSHLNDCELFPTFRKRASLRVWQTFYCENKFETCVRFQRALAGRPVPINLLPNGRELNVAALGA